MRRFLIFAALIILLILIIAISAQITLATARPFRPGHPIFPVQDFVEQARAQIIFGDTEQAIYYLDLAFQRTEDLVILRDSEHALLAIGYLDRALDQAIAAIAQAPEGDLLFLSSQLNALILNIEVVLGNYVDVPPAQERAIENLQAKITTLGAMLAGFSGIDQIAFSSGDEQASLDSSATVEGENDPETPEVQPQNVLFPPGSPGAMHEFFNLVGEHAELDCLACHSNAQYAGTPNLCADCHVEEMPDPHFSGDCAACHTSFSWQQINFDHNLAGSNDCKFCHLVN